MAITVDNLEISIQANATNATKAINDLKTALRSLNRSLTAVSKDGTNATDKLATNLERLDQALGKLSDKNVGKVRKLASSMAVLADSVSKLKGVGKITDQVDKANEAIKADEASASGSATGETPSKLQRLSEAWLKLAKAMKLVDENGKRVHGMLYKLGKMVGRIAIYRMIRSAIKAVSEAFSEGLKNAYMFSKQNETFQHLAETLDRVKTSVEQMKNQLGAMYLEFKNAMAPLVMKLIDGVIWAAERLTEIMAAFNGEEFYLHAERIATEWEKSNEELKKYKNQLLGLDELNILSKNEPSSSESGVDYSTLYTQEKVSDKLKFLATMKIGFEDTFFEWKNLTPEDIAQKCFAALGGFLGAIVGFSCLGWEGGVAGFVAGATITSMLSGAIFDHDGTLTKKELLKTLLPAAGGLAGALLTIEKGKGTKMFAITAGALIGYELADMIFDESDKTMPKRRVGKRIAAACLGLVGGIIGFKYYGKKGALVMASIGAIAGYKLADMIFKKADGAESDEPTIGKMIATASGALLGGTIGFEFGGIEAGLMGVTLGAVAGYMLSDMIFEMQDGAESDLQLIGSMIGGVCGALVGYSIGFVFGDVKAGFMTASLGAIVGYSVGKMFFEKDKNPDDNTIVLAEMIASVCGAITGAVIGFEATGSVQGAIVGLTVGALVTMEIIKPLFKKSKDASTDNAAILKNLAEDGLAFLVAAGITFAVSKDLYTAMLVGTLAVQLKLIVDDLDWDFSRRAKAKADVYQKLLDGTSYSELTAEETKLITTGGLSGVLDWFKRGVGISPKASGGTVSQGSLFYAGEAGPEFIGRMGSTSAVANTDQMTDAIYRASYMGMARALAENGGNNAMAGYEPATTDDLWLVLRKKNNQYSKMTGSLA